MGPERLDSAIFRGKQEMGFYTKSSRFFNICNFFGFFPRPVCRPLWAAFTSASLSKHRSPVCWWCGASADWGSNEAGRCRLQGHDLRSTGNGWGRAACAHLFPSFDGNVDVLENQVQVPSVTQAVVAEFHPAHLRPGAGRSHLLDPPRSLRWGGGRRWAVHEESEALCEPASATPPASPPSLPLTLLPTPTPGRFIGHTHTPCFRAFALQLPLPGTLFSNLPVWPADLRSTQAAC